MTPFFKRNRRRRTTAEELPSTVRASAPSASSSDSAGTEVLGDASEFGPASPDAQQPENPPIPVAKSAAPTAKQLVGSAYRTWWTDLSETAQASSRPLSALDPAVIDLSSPHPTGGAQLYSGMPTLLSSLVREESALRIARGRLGNLRHQIRQLSESYGYAPVTLAIGEISWTVEAARSVAENPETEEAPVSQEAPEQVAPANVGGDVFGAGDSDARPDGGDDDVAPIASTAAPDDESKPEESSDHDGEVAPDGGAGESPAHFQESEQERGHSDADHGGEAPASEDNGEQQMPIAEEDTDGASTSSTSAQVHKDQIMPASEARSEAVLLRTVRLHPAGEDDASITLTAKCEVNPAVLRVLREAGVAEDDLAGVVHMATNPSKEEAVLIRVRELGRHHLTGFGYEPRVLLGSFIHPGQALLADLESMKPFIQSSGIMAALAGDEPTKRLSSAPLPPAELRDRAPEAERGAGDRDVAELAAIEAVASGRSVTIDTPPGSDKVGTLAAIAADAAASGRSVLYIPGGATAGRTFIDRMQDLGLGDLVLDFSDMELVPTRLRTGLRLRHDESRDDEIFETRSALTKVRKDLGGYVEALHAVDPEWDESVYSLLEKLANLTARQDGPSSRTRLGEEGLRSLRDSYDSVQEALLELASLQTFSADAGASVWTGSNINTVEEATRALARATRIAQETLPVAMAQSQRVAGESALERAATLDDWIEQIRVLNGIGKTLDVFLPQVYERSVADLVAATATKEWREEQGVNMKSSERRRLTRQARDMVRPGASISDLHNELEKVQRLRESWRHYCSEGGWPTLPDGMAQIKATAAEVYREVKALESSLNPGTDLCSMRFEDLLVLVRQLASGQDAMATLPRRNALIVKVQERGLNVVIEDFMARHISTDRVVDELSLIYVNSVFEQLVVRTPRLANIGPADLKQMSEQLRRLDKEQTTTLAGPVRRAVVRIMRETISKRRDETMAFDGQLARYGSGGLRDAIASHSRLVQVARPVWTIPSMMTAEFVPPMPWADVVIMDEMDAADLATSISMLMRGSQVVAMGDLRRAPRRVPRSQSWPTCFQCASFRPCERNTTFWPPRRCVSRGTRTFCR